jgi:hypothetical protein
VRGDTGHVELVFPGKSRFTMRINPATTELANEDDDGWQMMDLNIHLHQVVAQENDRADGKHPEISSDSKDCRFFP